MHRSISAAVAFTLVGLPIFICPRVLAQQFGHYVLVSVQGSGVVSKTPDKTVYELGEAVTLTAVPARYFAFERWSDGSIANPRAITVGATNIYAAAFTNTVPLESLGLSLSWETSTGGSKNEVFRMVQQTYDGGFVLGGGSSSVASGSKTSLNFGNADFWLVRLDADGKQLWDRSFGGSDSDQLACIQPTPDGGFILGGSSISGQTGNKSSRNFGGSDYWIVRLDAGGEKLWDKSFGGANDDTLTSLVPTSEGGFILGGYSQSGANGNKTSVNSGVVDFWVVRLDAEGNRLWDKSFGGSGDDYLNNLESTSDGDFILGGQSNSGVTGNKASRNWGLADAWIVRLDSQGTKLWDKSFGGSDNDSLNCVQRTSDGGFVLGGYSRSSGNGNKTSPNFGGVDFWVVRVDAKGDKLWDASAGGSNEDILNSLRQTWDGGFVLGGYSRSGTAGNRTDLNFGGSDFWIVRLNADGQKVWDQALGGMDNDVLSSLDRTFDGGFVLGGHSDSTPSGNKSSPIFGGSDFWVARVAEALAPIGTPAVFINRRLYAGGRLNTDSSVEVELRTSFRNGSVFYTLDGSNPTFSSSRYAGAFTLTPAATIRAVAYSADFTVSAEADPVTVGSRPAYSLSVSTSGGGLVAINPPSGPYLSNSVVTLTATRSPGWTFMNWTGDATGTNTNVTVTINHDTGVKAVFGTTVNTTVAGQGTVLLSPLRSPYPYGSVVRLSAVPTAGHYFALWGNASTANSSPLDFVVTNSNPTISALFAPLSGGQVALSLLAEGEGRIRVDPMANAFATGQTVSLSATPENESRFLGWSGDASGRENPLKVTMDRSRTITANFVAGNVPWLGLPETRSDGTVQFSLSGAVGRVYVIQVSTNLRDWVDSSRITNSTSISIFSEPTSAESYLRFYRALIP